MHALDRIGPQSGFLDSQALAALGATRVDHGAATTGLHADQEAVGTGATNFGRLVSAFHYGIPNRLNSDLAPKEESRSRQLAPITIREPRIIANFLNWGNTLHPKHRVVL